MNSVTYPMVLASFLCCCCLWWLNTPLPTVMIRTAEDQRYQIPYDVTIHEKKTVGCKEKSAMIGAIVVWWHFVFFLFLGKRMELIIVNNYRRHGQKIILYNFHQQDRQSLVPRQIGTIFAFLSFNR
jgi:hypothetical protein